MPHHAGIPPAALATFGDLLRYLRRRAHLQQRDLAVAVGYSEGQICRLEQNRRLPDLTMLAARFVPALGLENDPEWAARLLDLARAARGEPLDATPSPTREARPRAPGANVPPGNLPAPLTTLINRTSEVAAVRGYLTRDDVRLLTLVGPPGIGKTRLSLQAANTLHDQFADGIFFVALAPIRDPARVLPAIAHTLKVKEIGDQSLIEAFRSAFYGLRMLLVLDNFEQVTVAAPIIAELLRATPGLKIVVTSRAALHLSGEQLYPVPPLELPDPRALPSLEELVRYPAVQLFIARVEAINPSFALTADNARTIVEICARLDGLPLAIELAASRSRLFSPQTLLDRLRDAAGPTTLHFLVDGPRDLLAHQQTLRSTIDWSYDMLDATARRTLMRLSAFVGGCAIEAAEDVCELSIENEELRKDAHGGAFLNSQFSILHSVEVLLDQSLLRQVEGPDGEPRFTMLETIREYAREQLVASGQANQIWRRHAEYHLELAESAERELSGAQQERWLQRLDAEYNNLWTALKWYAADDLAAGLRLAASLQYFWHARGYLKQGRAWLEDLLAHSANAAIAPAVRARALCAAGFLAYHQGDFAHAIARSEESLAIARALGERRGVADALHILAGAALIQNEYPRASALFEDALALYRELDARPEIALVLKNLGLVAKDQGNYARATAFLTESLALRRALDDARGVAQSLFNLGVIAYWRGDYARAAALTEQSLTIYRESGDKMGVAYALETLGMAVHRQDDRKRAMRLLEESLDLFGELGDQVGVALLFTDLGSVAESGGADEQAAHFYGEGLALAWKVGDKRRVAFCLEGLAAVARAQPRRAARLFGAAEALREAIGSPLPPAERADYERGVAAARTCSRHTFATAWAAGRGMSLEQVVSYALKPSSLRIQGR